MKRKIADIVERFQIEGRLLIADEVGSAEWQAAKDCGSKVELIRIRAGDTYPLPEGFENLSDEGEGK